MEGKAIAEGEDEKLWSFTQELISSAGKQKLGAKSKVTEQGDQSDAPTPTTDQSSPDETKKSK